MADLTLLASDVSETLESVGLLAVGLSDLKNTLSAQTEMTSRILAILTAEPEGPSPLGGNTAQHPRYAARPGRTSTED